MGGRSTQTNQLELESFYAQALPGFLEYLRTHGTDVGEIETASSLDGITSLPALYRVGGVEKTVLAPLSLLSRGVDDEILACQLATEAANTAAAAANSAASRVIDSILEIASEKDAAISAAAAANTAAAAANGAKISCDSATRACIEASELCASKTAECIEATLACVSAIIECVNETGNCHVATAAANTAAANANGAASNLNGIKTACQDITTLCTSTNQEATEKVAEMTSLMQNFSGEAQASPVKLEVTAPASISIANKVALRIGAKLYPSYVMGNVLFQKAEGDSLTVDPSGNLDIKRIGTSKFYVIPSQNTGLWQQVIIEVRNPRIRLTGNGKMRLNGGKIRLV